jgi:predicted alpha/beta-hydrolase family hydrolase
MASPEVRGTLEVGGTNVSTAWIAPKGSVATLVLAHGAGAGMDHPFMAGFSRAIAEAGVSTLRFNFPYVEAGKRSPDPERVLREAWLAAFTAAASKAGSRSVLAGGKSLGGRIASMCVADGMPADGLVFLGYPLHPPGKPERIRDEHLYRITVPMLFVQGTKDPFATPALLAKVLRKLGDRATLEPVEGGGHSFKAGGTKADDREIGAAIAEMAIPFVRRVATARGKAR